MRCMIISTSLAMILIVSAGGQTTLAYAPVWQVAIHGEPAMPDPGPRQGDELTPMGPPRVASYSDSGCLGPIPGTSWPCPDEDAILLTASGNTLHVLHTNATYNCCPDDIVISASVTGNLIQLTEDEILTLGCWCWCCYDVEATVVDLVAGEYTVEFCWFDYETQAQQCYTEQIVISPPSAPLPARTAGGKHDPVAGPADPAPQVPSPPPRPISPYVAACSNSGCLPQYPGACEDPDAIILTPGPGTLDVLHEYATYNCCLDDIAIAVSVSGNLITLVEEEILTNPCYCICCFNVEATVVDLAPGTYQVEFCWFDYETAAPQYYYEQVVIP